MKMNKYLNVLRITYYRTILSDTDKVMFVNITTIFMLTEIDASGILRARHNIHLIDSVERKRNLKIEMKWLMK